MMNKILVLAISMLLSVGAMAQKAKYKVFPFKTGIIEYKLEGSTKGTHTKYIKDYGYRQADYTKSKTRVLGVTSEENSGTIMEGAYVYSIDYERNVVTKTENPIYKKYINDKKEYEKIGKEALEALGYKNTGETEKILGETCEIWQGSLGKVWIWKHLALKSYTSIMGVKVTETVTKIDLNANVPSSKFEIPKGMKMEEVDMSEIMNEDMTDEDRENMEDLKNMSYSDFKKLMKKDNPDLTDEEIKQAYDMKNGLMNLFGN
ncbi:MAG: hypothetical protein KAG96_03665 [Ichthyobacteriaceae bacterium]|nr:hypothetical protein [Ichthyobacteriaceae bacterium]